MTARVTLDAVDATMLLMLAEAGLTTAGFNPPPPYIVGLFNRLGEVRASLPLHAISVPRCEAETRGSIVTVTEAAHRLNLSSRRVRQLRAAGVLASAGRGLLTEESLDGEVERRRA